MPDNATPHLSLLHTDVSPSVSLEVGCSNLTTSPMHNPTIIGARYLCKLWELYQFPDSKAAVTLKGCQVKIFKNPQRTSSIDFEFNFPHSSETQHKPMSKGHVVAVQITAENPDHGNMVVTDEHLLMLQTQYVTEVKGITHVTY
ncbi:hypothetical protein DFH28DRAFT_923119 [Melampsora americana]|nr:hypothetical protein DFH28DRAFT_923119 [Melampsora americana]